MPSASKFNINRTNWVPFTRSVKRQVDEKKINDKVSNVKNCILDPAMITIPKTLTNSAKHRVPWRTPDCRTALCERRRAYRLFKIASITRTFTTSN